MHSRMKTRSEEIGVRGARSRTRLESDALGVGTVGAPNFSFGRTGSRPCCIASRRGVGPGGSSDRRPFRVDFAGDQPVSHL